MDVNEWIKNECAGCVLPETNIRNWFTLSHPSKEENRSRKRSRSCECKRAFRASRIANILAANLYSQFRKWHLTFQPVKCVNYIILAASESPHLIISSVIRYTFYACVSQFNWNTQTEKTNLAQSLCVPPPICKCLKMFFKRV